MQEGLAQGEATSAGKARAGAVAGAGADAEAGESIQACVPEPGAATTPTTPTITWAADAESTGEIAEILSPHRAGEYSITMSRTQLHDATSTKNSTKMYWSPHPVLYLHCF